MKSVLITVRVLTTRRVRGKHWWNRDVYKNDVATLQKKFDGNTPTFGSDNIKKGHHINVLVGTEDTEQLEVTTIRHPDDGVVEYVVVLNARFFRWMHDEEQEQKRAMGNKLIEALFRSNYYPVLST